MKKSLLLRRHTGKWATVSYGGSFPAKISAFLWAKTWQKWGLQKKREPKMQLFHFAHFCILHLFTHLANLEVFL